jgi:hypothetical protein
MTCEILYFVWDAGGAVNIAWPNYVRGGVAAAAFVLLCILVYNHIVKGLKPSPGNVGNFVAFNTTIAIGGGAALVVGLSEHWTALLLVAGACLGGGFLFGILFGYPLSPKQPDLKKPTVTDGGTNTTPTPANGSAPQAGGAQAQPPVGANTPPANGTESQAPGPGNAAQGGIQAPPPAVGNASIVEVQTPAPVVVNATGASGQTLLKQAADGLSKVVAGASLVSIQPLYKQFLYVSRDVTNLAMPGSAVNDYTCGAALISYFLILGFLTGLLLPPFYHLVESPGDTTQSRP